MRPEKYPLIRHPLKRAAAEGLPVPRADMTNEELRKIVVDYAVMQGSFPWTPSRDLKYPCPGSRAADADGNLCFSAGEIYGGVIYTHAGRDLYAFLDHYDEETGVLDVDSLGDRPEEAVGNDCANALFWAWSRVSTSVTYILTRYMQPCNGCLRLGPYKAPADLTDFFDYNTKKICADNGPQTMFESYACLLPADGMVLYNNGRGHGMMAMEKAVVVRNEDGTVNGDESYVRIVEQHSPLSDRATEDGTVHSVGGIRNKKTFSVLYKEGNVPFRIPELAGIVPIRPAYVKAGLRKDQVQLEDLRCGVLYSNYVFSRVVATATADGKELFSLTGYGRVSADARRFRLVQLDWPETIPEEAELAITATLANGETLTAWEGKLVREPAVPVLKKKIGKAEFDALPVANASMTEDELRKIAVDYAVMQATLPWTPAGTVYYRCPSAAAHDMNGNLSFRKGTLYGGLPYTHHSSDAYAFLDHLDENNVLDTDSLGMGLGKILGNNCASAVFWALGRVSSRVTYTYTADIVPKNGCAPVGPYTYDLGIDSLDQIGTSAICKRNGEQTMFESYAAVLPADGFVLRNNGHGHGMMAYSRPEVVRNADGTIDGEKSVMTVVEQHSPLSRKETENGELFQVGGFPSKFTFAKLYSLGHIPFRVPEFRGQPLEPVRFALGYEKDLHPVYTMEELEQTVLTCNYPISQVWITVRTPGGREVTVTGHGQVKTARSLAFADLPLPKNLPYGKLTVTARAGNGEIRTLFEGRLERF